MTEHCFSALPVVLLVALGVGCGSNDVEWSTSSPASRGFDSERLAAFDERLSELSTDAVVVARDGNIVLESYSGWRGSRPEHIASLPKAVIGSLLFAAAVERGAVGFDDPVSRYVPQWKQDPQRAAATLRHLAAHRSGLENVLYIVGDDLSGEEEWRRTYQEKPDQPPKRGGVPASSLGPHDAGRDSQRASRWTDGGRGCVGAETGERAEA